MKVLSEDGIEYTVSFFERGVTDLQHLFKVFNKYDILISEQYKGDVNAFFDYVMSPQVVLLQVSVGDTPVGVLYADSIIPGSDANVHYIFWDRVTKGRQRLLLSVLKTFMKNANLPRVSIRIPVIAYAALNRLRHMGVWLEGRQRERVLYRGKRIDQLSFSILARELTDEVLEQATIDPEKTRGRWMKVLDDEDALASYFLRKEERNGDGPESANS